MSTKLNNINMVELFLKNGANPNQVDLDKKSAIFYAVENNNLEIVIKLIEYGADC